MFVCVPLLWQGFAGFFIASLEKHTDHASSATVSVARPSHRFAA